MQGKQGSCGCIGFETDRSPQTNFTEMFHNKGAETPSRTGLGAEIPLKNSWYPDIRDGLPVPDAKGNPVIRSFRPESDFIAVFRCFEGINQHIDQDSFQSQRICFNEDIRFRNPAIEHLSLGYFMVTKNLHNLFYNTADRRFLAGDIVHMRV